jgi:hypothetical protein
MNYSFNPYKSTPLCEIMGRNKSDKGDVDINTSWHNYTTFYYSIFKNIRYSKIRLFELGLGTNNTNIDSNMGEHGKPGASLYGWSEFFPNALIFGADIDKDILFQTDRIKTFYCDQTKPEIIKNMWNEPELKDNFDIIIEDGLHTYEANVIFFENSIHKLNISGYYIIEDVANTNIQRFEDKIKLWKNIYTDCIFSIVKLPSMKNYIDNNLIVIHKSKSKSKSNFGKKNNIISTILIIIILIILLLILIK